MLVISRRPREAIRIGDTVVTVTRVQGQTVRLGIEAPRDVQIVRVELPPLPPPATPAATAIQPEPSSDEQAGKHNAAKRNAA